MVPGLMVDRRRLSKKQQALDDPAVVDGGLVGARAGRSVEGSGSVRDEFSHCLLGLVAVRPMSSYDVTRALQSVIRYMWGAAESQVYAGLSQLEKRGLVIAREEANGRRSRRVFSVTPAGQAAVDEWLASVTPDRAPKDVFLLKLFFMGESTDEAALAHCENYRAHLLSFLEHGLAMRGQYEHSERRKVSRLLNYQLLSLDFAIARWEGELDLIDRAIEIVRKGIDRSSPGPERLSSRAHRRRSYAT